MTDLIGIVDTFYKCKKSVRRFRIIQGVKDWNVLLIIKHSRYISNFNQLAHLIPSLKSEICLKAKKSLQITKW